MRQPSLSMEMLLFTSRVNEPIAESREVLAPLSGNNGLQCRGWVGNPFRPLSTPHTSFFIDFSICVNRPMDRQTGKQTKPYIEWLVRHLQEENKG